jgi:phosphoglycerate dehydrogenase-like enzyme
MENWMAETETKGFRVAVLDDYEGLASKVPAYGELKKRANVEILTRRLATDEELGATLKDVDAILLVRERTYFKERELALASALKFISQMGQTTAHLDLSTATRRGIRISGTPGDSGVSTIELTFGLIFALMRHIPQVNRGMHEGIWPGIPGSNIEGKTLGVFGLGRIGKEVTRLGQAFRMKVLAAGKTLTDERARQAGAVKVSLEDLFKESDVVSIHVKLNQETRGMIGERELSLMKPGAVLINTGRGPIVSEAALIGALEKGQLAGAGLDVFDQEPLPSDHPLRRFDNVVLLSHRGYATVEILQQRYELAMRNIMAFMDGKPLKLLNPEVIESDEPSPGGEGTVGS